MRTRQLSGLGCAIACIGTAVAGCATPVRSPAAAPAVTPTSVSPHASHASRAHTVAVANGIVIDPYVGEVFVPDDDTNVAPLTAEQAFVAQARHSGSKRLRPPAGVTSHLGRLTLPIGPGSGYTARNELVWAFTVHRCGASYGMHPEAMPKGPCVEWMFLDAATGALIDDTYQQ